MIEYYDDKLYKSIHDPEKDIDLINSKKNHLLNFEFDFG